MLDFSAKRWQTMIKWNETDVYEPPLTLNLTKTDLLNIVVTPLQLLDFKCHTQVVERVVKDVTAASQVTIGEKRRDAIVKITMNNRSKYP